MTRKRPKSSQKGSGCSPMRRSDSRRKMLCGNWRLKHSINWGGCQRRKTSPSIRAWSTTPGWTCLLATQADLARREISPKGASRLQENMADAVAEQIAALKDEDWAVREEAATMLGTLRDPRAVAPLVSVLCDGDRAVREDAVRALGQIGDARAVEFLMTAMKEPGLRPLAVEALGRIGDRRAVPVLINVLEGVDRPEVSRPIDGCGDRWDEEMLTLGAAVRALGAIRDETAIPSLMKALHHTVTRAEAADALTRFGSAVIAPLLAVLARESDDNIRYHVKDTLAKVGWRAGRI